MWQRNARALAGLRLSLDPEGNKKLCWYDQAVGISISLIQKEISTNPF